MKWSMCTNLYNLMSSSLDLAFVNDNTSARLCMSAQRALRGAIPSSLRAFSVEVAGYIIRTRSVFDGTETQAHREMLSVAGSEIIADFLPLFTIEEEFLSLPNGTSFQHLHYVVFLREKPK